MSREKQPSNDSADTAERNSPPVPMAETSSSAKEENADEEQLTPREIFLLILSLSVSDTWQLILSHA